MNFWYEEIDINSIVVGEQVFDGYDTTLLKDSIADIGMVYEPVVELVDGKYVIRDGFQRLEVAKQLGYEKIRCKVYANNIYLSAKLAIDPNIARRHLTTTQIQYYRAKREELINKLQQQVLEKKEVVLDRDDIDFLQSIPASKLEQIFAAVEKKVQDKYAQLIREKEEKIKELEAKQIDLEELERQLRKKMKEKEEQIRQQVLEEQLKGKAADAAEVERLKAELAAYEQDLQEMNKSLVEMSRTINALKKEKEAFQEERDKILEERNFYKNLAQKYQNEIHGLKELEIKKLQNKIKQQESIVNALVRPDAIVQTLSVARSFLTSAAEQITRLYTALSDEVKDQIMQEVKQINDVTELIREIVEKGSEVIEVEDK